MIPLSYMLLYLCCLLIGSFGFSLFIVESPYFEGLRNLCRKHPSFFLARWALKGLDCYTCSGFIGGILYGLFFLVWFIQFPYTSEYAKALLIFLGGCIGCGFSTAMSYLMTLAFTYIQSKGQDNV